MSHNITPLPWNFTLINSTHGRPYAATINGAGDEENGYPVVADLPPRTISGSHEANAAFIVKACNSHGELVEKLRGMIALAEQMNDASDEGGQLDERHTSAVELLAKL